MAVIDWLLQAFITAIKNLKKAKANSVNCTFLLGSFVCVGGRGGGGHRFGLELIRWYVCVRCETLMVKVLVIFGLDYSVC